MSDNVTRLKFDDGTNEYIFPYIQQLSDPIPAMKATVIRGKRSDGSLVIPGGKRSIEVSVRGILSADGYVALTALINEMRTKVSTNVATLTLEHNVGAGWISDWNYTCRRIEEITFDESLRTDFQNYEANFLVISY